MAGAGRYKAGTIFLDVAPSFKNLQRQIKEHIEDGNLEKAAEDQGRKQGEALAKGEGDAYRKAAEKNLAGREKTNKAVNKSMVGVASKAYRDISNAAGQAEKSQTQAVEQGVKKRTAARRSEADEAKNLRLEINYLHTQALKDIDREEREARQDQKNRNKASLQEHKQLLKDRANATKRALDAHKKADDDFNKARTASIEKSIRDQSAAQKAAAQQLIDNQQLANAMHDGRIKANNKRIQAERAANAKFREEDAAAERKAAADRDKARTTGLTKAQEAWDRYQTAQWKAWEQQQTRETKATEKNLKERERLVSASGGRMGRLIRKSVGSAVEDLPPIEVDANTSKADAALAGMRARLIALRDAHIGVDIDSGAAMTELTAIRTSLATVARTHDGSVRINAMAALASLQAVDKKLSEVRREAKRPMLMPAIRMGGNKGVGEDGANAFRVFNAMVLATVAALSILSPAVAVAAAGLVTLAGTAIAGAGALGVLALGFQGVFKAIQDQIKAEDEVGQGAEESAKKRATAARQVQTAKQNLADAETDAARASQDAARQVADAERGVSEAHKAAAKGVKDALRERSDAERDLVDAKRDAAESVRSALQTQEDAERALADVRRQVASDVDAAVDQQAQAERRLEDAQRSAAQVQRDLTEARREARREIEDLSMSYRQSQLAEAEASIAITQAQERLNEVRRRQAKGDASSADVRQAALDVQQARLRAEEARTRRQRAGQDSSVARKRGVEGSDRVIQAKDAVRSADQQVVDSQRALAAASKRIADTRVEGARKIADAERNVSEASRGVTKARSDSARQVADAERALADASRGVSEARAEGAQRVSAAERTLSDALRNQDRVAQDNARSIRDAQQAVKAAQEATAEAANQTSAAAQNAQKSMADLSPAGQRFAAFILGLRGEYGKLRDVAQAGMLPGLERGMRELGIYKSGFRTFVQDMSQMWGDSFASMGKQLTNPTWRSFFHTLGQDGPKQAGLFGQAIFNVAETLAALTDAFSPLTTEMLTWLEKATAGWADWAASLKGSPAFERFLDYVREMAPIVGGFVLSIARAFIALGRALAPFAKGAMLILTKFFNWVADMDPALLGKIAVGILSLFVAFQLGSGAVALMSGALSAITSPLAMVVIAISALAIWMVHLYQTNDRVRGILDALGRGFKAVWDWMGRNKVAVMLLVGAFGIFLGVAKLVSWVIGMGGILGIISKLAPVLLNLGRIAAFAFGPWGLAIMAVVGAIIYLWKTNESFRDTMKAIWGGIKRAIGAVVSWFTDTAVPAMGRAFDWIVKNVLPPLRTALGHLGDAITWLWENVVRPYLGFIWAYWSTVFKGIVAIVRWMWDNAVKPIFAEMVRWFKEVIAPAATWLWKNALAPAFRAIGGAARWMWYNAIAPAFRLLEAGFGWIYENVVKPVARGIGRVIKNNVGAATGVFRELRRIMVDYVGPGFLWLLKNVVKPVASAIGRAISWMWKNAVKPVFRALRRFVVDYVGPAFSWLWSKAIWPALKAIGRGIAWMWKSSKPVFRALRRFIVDYVGPAFSWLWKKAIWPALKAIGRGISWMWKNSKPVFRALRRFLVDYVGPAFSWLWKKAIRPAIRSIAGVIEWLWKKSKPIFRALRRFLIDKVGPAFSWLWRKGVRPAIRSIKTIIEWLWDKAKKSFENLRGGLSQVKKAFDWAKKGIKSVWENLKEVIAKPIDSALKFIQTNFIDKINSLLKKAGLELRIPTVWGKATSPKASGYRAATSRSGGNQRYAEGGIVQGPWRGPKADNVLGVAYDGTPTAWVNPKEHVTRVASTERMERNHPGMLDYINRHGTLPGFAGGGLVGRLPKFAKGGMIYPDMIRWIKENIPGTAIHSAYRPGAITATGNKSYHGRGKALDLTPSMAVFNKILSGFGKSNIAELIYSPANGRQVAQGRHKKYGQPTRGDHWDHVHWAMESMSGGLGGGFGLDNPVIKWLGNQGKKVIDKIPGDNVFADMSKGYMKKVLGGITTKAQDEIDSMFGGDDIGMSVAGIKGGMGVAKWRTTVRKALWKMNQPASLADTVLRRMNQESGGNARAINNWDSNAAIGQASRGLMQVIPSTFKAYRHPSYSSNIFDPMANILASMRYALARYGSLSRAYNREGGYATGTDSATAGWHMVGEEGPELMRFRGGEQVYNRSQTMRLAELSSKGGQAGPTKVYVQNPWTGEYLMARVDTAISDNEDFKASVGRMH